MNNKSELAIARDEWFVSKEGRKCSEFPVTSYGYLRNRLEAAFWAGSKANLKVKQEICDKHLEPFDLESK